MDPVPGHTERDDEIRARPWFLGVSSDRTEFPPDLEILNSRLRRKRVHGEVDEFGGAARSEERRVGKECA